MVIKKLRGAAKIQSDVVSYTLLYKDGTAGFTSISTAFCVWKINLVRTGLYTFLRALIN